MKFEIEGEDYSQLCKFKEKHKGCLEKHGNATGAQYEYTFVCDGLGVFKTVRCCCGKHINLTSDYDLNMEKTESTFKIYSDYEKTREILKMLNGMKHRPRMFFPGKLFESLSIFLDGYASGIRGESEYFSWSEMGPYVWEEMSEKCNSGNYTDEELFNEFFVVLESVINNRFPKYKGIID